MKFDVIISNPPYNNDIYLDFVEASLNLLKTDGIGVFVTPAKFYAKGGAKNEHFRQKIMPHIKEVHLYKCCTDIFDIAERGGIAYYSVYKKPVEEPIMIQNHSGNGKDKLGNEKLRSSLEVHTEQPVQFMSLECLSLLNKISSVSKPLFDLNSDRNPVAKCYYCSDTQTADTMKQETNTYALMSGVGGELKQQGYVRLTTLKRTDNVGKFKIIVNEQASGIVAPDKNYQFAEKVVQYIKPNEIPKGSFIILQFAEDEPQAKSYCSWFNSQLVNFIMCITAIGNKSNTKENWRHVPALPEGYSFDHIYTNEEIFDIFQLTDEERKLITSVIKPRVKK